MHYSRGGMGAHKHYVSGTSPRSPRYKFLRALEANRKLAQAPKRKALTAQTVQEAMEENDTLMRRSREARHGQR